LLSTIGSYISAGGGEKRKADELLTSEMKSVKTWP